MKSVFYYTEKNKEENIMMYIIRDAEAGNIISKFTTYDEAATELAKYEAEDKADGTYTEGFYEIIEE